MTRKNIPIIVQRGVLKKFWAKSTGLYIDGIARLSLKLIGLGEKEKVQFWDIFG